MAAQSKEVTTNQDRSRRVKDVVTATYRTIIQVAKSWFCRLDKWISKLLQFLKFETDKTLRKPYIYTSYRFPWKLIAKLRQCRRSLASAAAGVVGNGVIAGVLPMFLPAVLLNCWQLIVTALDYHRVRCELKRRARWNPTYIAYCKMYNTKCDALVDILLGCMLKLLLLSVTWGLIGFDAIAEGFLDAATSKILANSLDVQCSAQPSIDGFTPSPPPPKPSINMYERLAENSIAMGKMEEARNYAFNGIGDQIALALDRLTNQTIDNATTWKALAEALTLVPRPEHVKIAAQVGAAGAAAELAQPLGIGMQRLAERLTDLLLKPRRIKGR